MRLELLDGLREVEPVRPPTRGPTIYSRAVGQERLGEVHSLGAVAIDVNEPVNELQADVVTLLEVLFRVLSCFPICMDARLSLMF